MRDAIWDAAIDLFADKGFEETTVDEIVDAAGVSRRSFFRYFSSKNDLMTQRGTLSYETLLTDAIQSCPSSYSISEILRHTVLEIARHSAAEPRTRKIMEIAAKCPSARAALSRIAELQEPVAKVFARRCGKISSDPLTPNLLAGMTLSILSVTFQAWFENGEQDISVTVDRAFATLGRLVCHDKNPKQKNQPIPAASNRNGKRSRQ